MKLSSAHVSTACVRVQLQMEYTLKGYVFGCTHTLAYKSEAYFGLYAQKFRVDKMFWKLFLKEGSYADKGCIYWIKNAVKQ